MFAAFWRHLRLGQSRTKLSATHGGFLNSAPTDIIIGTIGAVHTYLLRSRKGDTRTDDRSVQYVAECAGRQAEGYLQGRQHAAHREPPVSYWTACLSCLYSPRPRVDDIEDDAQLRRGVPGM